MPLWQLQPVDSIDPSWEASTYRGKVIVRARDEAMARRRAQEAFGVKTRFPLKKGVAAPPWKRPALVKAEVIEDPLYDPEGPPEVLFPPQA